MIFKVRTGRALRTLARRVNFAIALMEEIRYCRGFGLGVMDPPPNHRVRRSLGLVFAERYAALVIELAASLALVRILTPGEIGGFAVAAAIVHVGQLLREAGATQYIIQEKILTPAKLRAAFSLQLGLAIVVALLILVGREPLAAFYRSPELRTVLAVLSIAIVLVPFGSVSTAVLRRELRFGAIAFIGIGASIVQAATAVVLAVRGFGMLSLAFAAVAGTIASILLAAIARPRGLPWLPGLTGVGAALKFGSWFSIGSIATALGNRSPELVLGRAAGFESVAQFDKAASIVELFNRLVMQGLWQFAAPYFAKQLRDNAPLGPVYLQATHYVTGLGVSFFAVTAIMAESMVMLLFGSQWLAITPVLRILCIGGALGTLFGLQHSALIAMGRIKTLTKLILLVQTVKIVTIVALSASGLMTLATGLVISGLACSLLIRWNLRSVVTISELLRSGCNATLMAALASIGPLFVAQLIDPTYAHGVPALALALSTAMLGWLIAAVVIRHPIRAELRRLPAIKRYFRD